MSDQKFPKADNEAEACAPVGGVWNSLTDAVENIDQNQVDSSLSMEYGPGGNRIRVARPGAQLLNISLAGGGIDKGYYAYDMIVPNNGVMTYPTTQDLGNSYGRALEINGNNGVLAYATNTNRTNAIGYQVYDIGTGEPVVLFQAPSPIVLVKFSSAMSTQGMYLGTLVGPGDPQIPPQFVNLFAAQNVLIYNSPDANLAEWPLEYSDGPYIGVLLPGVEPTTGHRMVLTNVASGYTGSFTVSTYPSGSATIAMQLGVTRSVV